MTSEQVRIKLDTNLTGRLGKMAVSDFPVTTNTVCFVLFLAPKKFKVPVALNKDKSYEMSN